MVKILPPGTFFPKKKRKKMLIILQLACMHIRLAGHTPTLLIMSSSGEGDSRAIGRGEGGRGNLPRPFQILAGIEAKPSPFKGGLDLG